MKTYASTFGIVALTLAMLGSGCSDGRARSPTAPQPPAPTPAPTPAPPQPPAPEILYSLSGVIFEETSTGRVPVENVEIYCEPCGRPGGHSARFTDAQGAYSFDGPQGGVAVGTFEISLAKKGFVLPGQPDQSGASGLGSMGRVPVTIRGDTRLDVQILRK